MGPWTILKAFRTRPLLSLLWALLFVWEGPPLPLRSLHISSIWQKAEIFFYLENNQNYQKKKDLLETFLQSMNAERFGETMPERIQPAWESALLRPSDRGFFLF